MAYLHSSTQREYLIIIIAGNYCLNYIRSHGPLIACAILHIHTYAEIRWCDARSLTITFSRAPIIFFSLLPFIKNTPRLHLIKFAFVCSQMWANRHYANGREA